MYGDLCPSTPSTVHPAVFIASLTDYVNGILHGRWVDARSITAMADALTEVLASSPWTARTGEPAEEWIILDDEGFPGAAPGAHEPLDSVWALAVGLVTGGGQR
jgi:antirestriction protein